MIDEYAFPLGANNGTAAQYRGMKLRDYFAIHAPEPTKDEIDQQFRNDQTANPHGDSYKPKRRSRLEIISDLRYAYADAMIAAREKVTR